MRISHVAGRSFPLEGPPPSQPPPRRSRRAIGLIIAALVLLAAFLVAGPYISSALNQGYSILSGSSNTGAGTVGPSTGGSNGTSSIITSTSCSSVVSAKALAAPDIKNGTADVSYPPDYCTLADYALGLINQDRASNGSSPVTLAYNQAGQQHADSMLYYGYFSHFDTQGYKPYMRYTLLGGVGAVFENVASATYSRPHFATTDDAKAALKVLEWSMMYNDTVCCGNGHRTNILNPLHDRVSVGVAYNSTTLFLDEDFENYYVNMSVTTSNSSAVTMRGQVLDPSIHPSEAFVAYDGPPVSETPTQLNLGPRDYGAGLIIGGVLPPCSSACPTFSEGITVHASHWEFTPKEMKVSFSLALFIQEYGAGVYTIYFVTGSDTDSAITSFSIFVG